MAIDKEIAVATVFMESSNQGPLGRRAVLHSIFNRLHSSVAPRYGRSLADVCLRPEQYSSWNTSDPNRRRLALITDDDPVWLDCLAAYGEITKGADDPTFGATHYYDLSIQPPYWTERATFTVQIDRLRFFSNVP